MVELLSTKNAHYLMALASVMPSEILALSLLMSKEPQLLAISDDCHPKK
jgi:hypothetical protein